MFDTAIIGTGPAGISAALTLRALKKDIILFGAKQLSGKIRAAERIRNYPGLPDVTGQQMQESFSRQLEQMEIPITEKTVTDEDGVESIEYTIDFTGKSAKEVELITEYIKYADYLSKWDGKLPTVMAGDSATVMIPTP